MAAQGAFWFASRRPRHRGALHSHGKGGGGRRTGPPSRSRALAAFGLWPLQTIRALPRGRLQLHVTGPLCPEDRDTQARAVPTRPRALEGGWGGRGCCSAGRAKPLWAAGPQRLGPAEPLVPGSLPADAHVGRRPGLSSRDGKRGRPVRAAAGGVALFAEPHGPSRQRGISKKNHRKNIPRTNNSETTKNRVYGDTSPVT